MRSRTADLKSFADDIGTGAVHWSAARERVLDYLDDLDAAVRLAGYWPMRRLLGMAPLERLDRWTITTRLSDLALRDADFRQDFLRYPRVLSALAACEGIGIGPASYLWQVRAATVVEEAPGLHWLVLPECHRGCETLGPRPGPCAVCGNPRGCAQAAQSGDAEWDLLHDIDECIIRSAQAEPSALDAVLRDPTAFFEDVARARFNVSAAGLGIREVRVARDSDTSVVFVLLARHAPHLNHRGTETQRRDR